MTWQGIEGHDEVAEKLRRAVATIAWRAASSFAARPVWENAPLALRFAQALLCQARPAADLDPCNTCPSCSMALGGTHPDIEVVAKPEEKALLPVELFLGDREHRGREGLCHWIGLKPFMGGRRIAIIDDADFFNEAGANCLLKTLEEPPPQSVLILIGTSPARQLPTIRSRCQLIRFLPLAEETVARLLISKALVADKAEAARLARFSEGSLQQAMELADADLWNCRRTLLEKLSAEVLDSTGSGPGPFGVHRRRGQGGACPAGQVPPGGGLCRRLLSPPGTRTQQPSAAGRPRVRGPLEAAARRFRGDSIVAAACLERCLDALGQIDRNANQATLVEAWLDDLAAETAGAKT